MRRLAASVMMLLAVPAAAQCGSPCEPVRWPLPTWAALTSPTPFIPDSAGLVPTSTPEPTITPTPGENVDVGGIGEALATLDLIAGGTMPPMADASGTPFTLPDMLATASADGGDFWGYTKGVTQSAFLGPFGPFGPFGPMLLVILVTLFLLKGSTFFLPIMFAVFGLIRKVVSLVLDFIPF